MAKREKVKKVTEGRRIASNFGEGFFVGTVFQRRGDKVGKYKDPAKYLARRIDAAVKRAEIRGYADGYAAGESKHTLDC